jgi:hypothetical protein
MGASLLTIHHFKPDVERIPEDNLLSLLWHHIVLGDVADIGTVPIKK